MNMNPAAVASARTARLAREAATPVYSTDTVSAARRERERLIAAAEDYAGEEFCFICSRATDHRGEHEDEQLLAFVRSPRGRMLMRR
jgi:hypothetical protein